MLARSSSDIALSASRHFKRIALSAVCNATTFSTPPASTRGFSAITQPVRSAWPATFQNRLFRPSLLACSSVLNPVLRLGPFRSVLSLRRLWRRVWLFWGAGEVDRKSRGMQPNGADQAELARIGEFLVRDEHKGKQFAGPNACRATNWEWSLTSGQPSELNCALTPSLVRHEPPRRQAICVVCAFVIPHGRRDSRLGLFSAIDAAAHISRGSPTRQNGLVACRQE